MKGILAFAHKDRSITSAHAISLPFILVFSLLSTEDSNLKCYEEMLLFTES